MPLRCTPVARPPTDECHLRLGLLHNFFRDAHCRFLAIVLGGFHLPIDDHHEVLLRNGVADAEDFKSELVELAF